MIQVSQYLSLPPGPVCYIAVGCMDGGSPSTGGVVPALFDDVETFMETQVRWSRMLDLGHRGLCLFWYAGQAAANYTAGYYPASYPGTGGQPIDYIAPQTEAMHVAAVGSSYLNQLEPFLAQHAERMYRPPMYSGPPPIDSGITTPELRAHSTVLRSVKGEPEWDSAAVIDPTPPNLPAWLAREDLRSQGFKVTVEAWDANYIPALAPWYGPGFGGASCVANNGVQGNQRADIAIAPGSGFYTPELIRAAGGRPRVFILDFVNPETNRPPTPAQKIARMSWWMSRGCDVYLSASGFTDKEGADSAKTATAWTRRWNRVLIEARHARTFMRR